MKVSKSGIEHIYREQVKKARSSPQSQGVDDFKKALKGATGATEGPVQPKFHPPSGVNLVAPVFKGRPVAEVDPVETLRFAAEVIASVPDIRQDRVDSIKKLIDSGQYNVSAKSVAERLLKTDLLTRTWEG